MASPLSASRVAATTTTCLLSLPVPQTPRAAFPSLAPAPQATAGGGSPRVAHQRHRKQQQGAAPVKISQGQAGAGVARQQVLQLCV